VQQVLMMGSRSHYIAVGLELESVRELGESSVKHQKTIDFLKDHQITTIAMESIGLNWQSSFHILQEADFEVLLVSGNQISVLPSLVYASRFC